jgi:phosphoribosylamine--glycine ligase
MNILLLGSGGREHALAWKMAQSPELSKLFIAPGNAGTSQNGTNIQLDLSDFESIAKFSTEHEIHMVVVGPEVPLVEGIRDYFEARPGLKDIILVGPDKKGAMLEGSKDFAKAFMLKYNIPTAAYQTFGAGETEKGKAFLGTMKPPYVLKADGLAAGKGVVILDEIEDALDTLAEMIDKQKFGKASSKVVIEEFLSGIEVSVFVLTDGKNYVILPEAKDYKRIGEGDTGLNTGGMGSISPVPFADAAFMEKVEQRIIKPTIEGLNKENINYQGFIFFGLIKVDGDPMVIEYNCRMGDPESEAVIPRIKSDLLPLFVALKDKTLNKHTLEILPDAAASVFLVSGGYPEAYEKGKVITGLDKINDSILFNAGTKLQDGNTVSNGGRVIAVTSFGKTISEALAASYKNVKNIHFDKMNYREDLGKDLMEGKE